MNHKRKTEAQKAVDSSDLFCYRDILRRCPDDGTRTSMTQERFEKMCEEDKQTANSIKAYWSVPDHHFIAYCSKVPGVCSLSHCWEIHKHNAAGELRLPDSDARKE